MRSARNDRFLLVTHENPDGDALGSIRAMKLALDAIGKESAAYLGGRDGHPARSTRSCRSTGCERELPADAADRVILALDCANASRTAIAEDVLAGAPLVVDIDHHHDNTRFGRINLIVPDASSTGEIVRELIVELGVPLTPEIAEALYVALVTDTGRFQYTNTTKAAHVLAAELFDAGLDVEPQAPRVPGDLRVDRVREAEAARQGARPGRAVRGRAAGGHVPAARATSASSASGRSTPRG